MKLEKYWQRIRARRLANEGFTELDKEQMEKLSKLAFYKTPYMRHERRRRTLSLRAYKAEAERQGWSKRKFNREWNNYILSFYLAKKYMTVSGKLDFWQLFRAARADAKSKGIWDDTPPYRKFSHRRDNPSGKGRIDKGMVKEQRARYRASHSERY